MIPDTELARLPVCKLSGKDLLPVIGAIGRADGSRPLSVANALEVLNLSRPGRAPFDAKHGFRAMVSPTLTHLHLARSAPTYFRLAPNGRLLLMIQPRLRAPAMGLFLRDLVSCRLGLSMAALRAAAVSPDLESKVGRPLSQKVKRFYKYLDRFPPPDWGDDRRLRTIAATSARSPLGEEEARSLLLRTLDDALKDRETLPLDFVRLHAQEGFLKGAKRIISSFALDRLLEELFEDGSMIIPLIGGASRIDTLVFRSRPVIGLRRASKG